MPKESAYYFITINLRLITGDSNGGDLDRISLYLVKEGCSLNLRYIRFSRL
jgi:hypothetical protein